jgi:hypothetical protein
MKILSYSLFCFIFCFLGLCDDEEDNCTKLEKEITVRIYSELVDFSEKKLCDKTFAVDFYKDHCGGGPSGQMSYTHQGCYDLEGYTYISKVGIGTWDITFKYEEDRLNVNIVNPNSKITSGSISGKQIYDETNGGNTALRIYGLVNSLEEIKIGFGEAVPLGN